MRTSLVAASGVVAALLTAVGCMSILAIPERSLSWCNRPENKHDFCEDFDHPDAASGWVVGAQSSTSSMKVVASDDTPPNAVDLSIAPLALDAGAVTGLFKEFPSKNFAHVRFEADVRFVDVHLESQGGVTSQVGFLLLQEPAFCVGMVVTPSGIGMVMRAKQRDCTTVSSLPVDAGNIVDDAGLTAYAPIAPIPGSTQWFHVKLEVQRRADNGGNVTFDINYPGVINAPAIPAGFLQDAPPAIAVATSVAGPSGRVELQFDNVTVDFSPN
jgi:hypothetical protein